jgi:hypothetical protein
MATLFADGYIEIKPRWHASTKPPTTRYAHLRVVKTEVVREKMMGEYFEPRRFIAHHVCPWSN